MRSLRATCLNVRLAQDISKSLRVGPTACDASAAFSRSITSGTIEPSACRTRIRALESRRPKGLTPLKWLFARPSQNERNWKMALIMVGVLRGSTLRATLPSTWKIPDVSKAQTSWPWPANSPNMPEKVPCEDATSVESNRTVEFRSSGLLRTWNGKSPAFS